MTEFERIEFFVCLEREFPSPLHELLRFRFIDRYSIEETCIALGLSSARQYYNIYRRIDRKKLRRFLHAFLSKEEI
jgi:hypothetical protein